MSKVRADMSGISSKLARIAKDSGLGSFLASEAAKGMSKYVPRRTGALSHSAQASPFKVTYSMPYARRVFYGVGLNIRTDVNPLASARWSDKYVEEGGAEELGKVGTAYLKGR